MKATVSVLVVDDEPAVLRITKLSLEKAGYQVVTAGNGEEALDMLCQDPFDVLVTDINMPRMSGEELCAALATAQLAREPLVFVATGRPGEHHRAWAGGLKNVELMEKPISLRSLTRRIGERLREAAAAQQQQA